MKFFIVLASVILAINAASDKELWSEFKLKHGRQYKNLREEQLRFSVFQSNLRTIETHNEKYDKGEESYYMGVNQFSDMTPQEFKSMLTYKNVTKSNTNMHKLSGVQLPASVDWRQQGLVTGVKNQGACGSCWAFSTTGAVEALYARSTGYLASFSEQLLVDCDTTSAGCNGGSMQSGFDFIRNNGIETELDYPYTAVNGACRYNSGVVAMRISGYFNVAQDENSLADAVANAGPVSVAINADHFQNYAGGIFYDTSCDPNSLDHGVLVVGYGNEGIDYWLVKNSWGSGWGEAGYVRMARNMGNQCGIVSDASYPHL